MSEQSSFASRSHEPKVYIAPPAVRIAQARLRHELARYQQWRERLPLKERFDELLWSPQGMRFIRPHKPGDPEWVRQKLFWQRTYGDGHRNDRAGLQQQALETCKCIIYAPLRLAKNRADNRKKEYQAKLSDLKIKCDGEWDSFQERICAIGERFWGEWWLDIHSGAELDLIRDKQLPKVQEQRKWHGQLKKQLSYAVEHLGPWADAKAQEYLACLRRAMELSPHVQPHLDFQQLLPDDARYTRPREGRPRPPSKACERALKDLEPKIPAHVIQNLVIAWSIKDYPKTPA